MPRPRSERLSAPRVLGHVVVMLTVAAVMGLVAAGLAIPFAGVLGIGTKQVASGMTKLPAELKTQPLAQRTVMVDAAGNVIATLYDENRINVPLSQISRKMVKAIVAIEDYRYYEHGALDLKGTLRALITNQAMGLGQIRYQDLTPLNILMREYVVAWVKADSPLASIRDVVARLKKDPQSVSFAFAKVCLTDGGSGSRFCYDVAANKTF